MTFINTIVADAEKLSRETLAAYIRDYCPDVEIVAECDSVKTAYAAILKFHPQLVILEIELSDGTGFDLLRMFKTIDFGVIFITAFSEYAIRAFRFSAADYLLKPVKVDELIDAVNKVRNALKNNTVAPDIPSILENLSAGTVVDNLVISDTKGFTVVRVHDVIKCEAEKYYTHFYLTGGKKVTSSKNLKYFEELLNRNHFLRVHRFWLINLLHVESYTHQGEISLTEENKCPLGNNYRKQFMEKTGNL